MNTTLRMRIDNTQVDNYSETNVKLVLAQSPTVFFEVFTEDAEIYLTKTEKIAIETIEQRVVKYKINTFGDLLSAFGFKKYEIYANNKLLTSVTLNNKGNTIRKGGFLKTQLGIFQNKKLSDELSFSMRVNCPNLNFCGVY